MQNQQDQQDLVQAFDYINMDDGFDPVKDSPGFGTEQLEKDKSPSPDKSPAADREKYKAPDIKKNSEIKLGKAF